MSEETRLEDLFAVAEKDLPLRDWMLKDRYDNGIFERGQLSVVGGTGGGGKSVLTIGQAIAMASGKRFGPWVPKKAYRVLMINAEDTADDQRRRMYAAPHSADAQGIRQQDIGDRLQTLVSPDLNLVSKNEKSKTINPTELYTTICKTITDRGIDFLFLDPLVELSVGCNENDNGEMHRVVAILRQLAREKAVHAGVVHHFRKGAGASDSGSVRGAGAITALGRFNMNVEEVDDKDFKLYKFAPEDAHRILRVIVAKNNHGPTGSTHFFRKAPQSIANGESIIALECFEATKAPVDITDKLILQVLERLDAGQPESGSPFSAAHEGPHASRADSLLCSAFGLCPDAAHELLSRLEDEQTIEVVAYKDKWRAEKKGYAVRTWPKGKKKPKGKELPF